MGDKIQLLFPFCVKLVFSGNLSGAHLICNDENSSPSARLASRSQGENAPTLPNRVPGVSWEP
jgi:hypothetical protein